MGSRYCGHVNSAHQRTGTVAGVTGTRHGMTTAQAAAFRELLTTIDAAVLHHGDCVGVDAHAHAIARELGLYVIGHPPIADGLRAFCDCDELRPPKPFMMRNREIAHAVQRLIGVPEGVQRVRSGTWATIRIALRMELPTMIIYPDGRREAHGWD